MRILDLGRIFGFQPSLGAIWEEDIWAGEDIWVAVLGRW